jgi:hypothetical protein
MGKIGSKAAVVMISAVLLLAGSLAIVPGAGAAPGLRFGANYKLSSNTPGRGVDVPGLAVDPGNQSHIVEANIDPIDQQCEFHVSFDGGQTWTGGVLTLPAPTATIAYPSPACSQNFDAGGYAHFNTGIVFGSGQNVYVTFSIHQGPFNRPESGPSSDGGNGDDAVVARSTDGGQTFQPAVLAVPGGGPTSANPGLAGYGMRPQLAVQRGAGINGQDRLYVSSWNCYIRIRVSQSTRGGCSGGGGDRRIFITRSDDGGATWNPPVLASAANVRSGTVSPPTGAAGEAGSTDEQAVEPSQPVIGPDGAVYVAYKNRDITDGTTCPVNANRPALTPTPPSPFPSFPSTKAYCVVVARSTNGGNTWTQFNTGVPVPSATLINPRLAIDPSVGSTGKLYVVYQRQIGLSPTPTDPSDITMQSSTDGAATWSLSPVRVNDDPPGAVQTNPWVSVGPSGIVDVIWWDQRNPYPGATVGNVYFAQSSDGGATFAPNRRVTDHSINEGVGLYSYLGEDFSTGFDWYGPTLLPLNDGSVLAAWTDSRLGNYDNGFQDIFLSRLSGTSGIPKSTIATATPSGLSVVLSRLAYPGGPEEINGNAVTKVVVANQSDVAGALAGAVLARANWGPLLLSDASGLSPVAQADARRMVPEGGYVIGDTSTLSTTVSNQLLAATRNGENVTRIAPANSVPIADRPADIARQIALLMFPLPGSAPTAVIANPGTPEAVSAAALAASLQYPILYVDTRSTLPNPLPPPTTAAISTLGVKKVLIVGGSGSVNSSVETSLDTMLGAPNVTRLGGGDQYATSQAVANASVNTFHLPDNVVYAADGTRPIDGAVLGAAVARLGGLMLLTPGASTDAAETALSTSPLALDASTDRIVGAIGTGGTDPTLPPPAQHSLIVSLAGNGSGAVSGSGIACPGVCTTSSVSGAGVTLTATPAAGSTFGGWSGACGGKATCTGTLSTDLHVTATFFRTPVAAPKCTLKVKSTKVPLKKGKKGFGTLTVSVRCNQSAKVSLRAVLTEKLAKKPAKTFRLGPVRSSVKANVSKNLALKVPLGARNGLKKKARESVKLTLTATNANGTSHASATIGRLKRG